MHNVLAAPCAKEVTIRREGHEGHQHIGVGHSLLADGDWREHPLLNVDQALMRGGQAPKLPVALQRVWVRQPHVCSSNTRLYSAQPMVG